MNSARANATATGTLFLSAMIEPIPTWRLLDDPLFADLTDSVGGIEETRVTSGVLQHNFLVVGGIWIGGEPDAAYTDRKLRHQEWLLSRLAHHHASPCSA